MGSLFFVGTDEFNRLKRETIGVPVIDSDGIECILLDDFIIKVFDRPVEEDGEDIQQPVE